MLTLSWNQIEKELPCGTSTCCNTRSLWIVVDSKQPALSPWRRSFFLGGGGLLQMFMLSRNIHSLWTYQLGFVLGWFSRKGYQVSDIMPRVRVVCHV